MNMRIKEDLGGCLPNQEQLLFLKACLGDSHTSQVAWSDWRSSHTLNDLDEALFRLLPLLYWNLQRNGIDDPDMRRLKGIYRRNWYCNQTLFHTIEQELQALSDAGMPAILLKGTALSYAYYPDPNIRSMLDGDVMVRLDHVEPAFTFLMDRGWRIKTPPHARPPSTRALPLKRDFKTTMHACTFANKAGHELDLHWHLFPEWCSASDEVFWRDCVPLKFRTCDALTLSPGDHLLHTCMHGYRWNLLHPLRWIVDAHMIIKSSAGRVDWELLARRAKERLFTLRLLKSLEFLRSQGMIEIPDEAFVHLRKNPVPSFEYFEHSVITKEGGGATDPKGEVVWHFQRIWCTHRRQLPDSSLLKLLFSYPATLANEFYLDGPWQLPPVLLSIARKKLRHLLDRVKRVISVEP